MKREEKNMSFRCFFNNRKDNEVAFQRTKRKRPPIITRIYNSEKEEDNDLALLDQIELGTGRQRPFPFFIILFCDDDDDDFLTTICRQN